MAVRRGLVVISLTPSPWTTTNGLPEWTAKWTTLYYLPWKKKDNQSSVVLVDGQLPSPFCLFFFMLLVSCSTGAFFCPV